MFSETRYARNGDLRVAYRTSAKALATSCSSRTGSRAASMLPELPSLQGWVEATTSLGRLIFFDQPGTGASDPVTRARCRPWSKGRQHHRGARRSRSRERSSSRSTARSRGSALFAATYPSRTTALVVLEGNADTSGIADIRGSPAALVGDVGHGGVAACLESGHAMERGDPGNIGSNGTHGSKPSDRCSHDAAAVRNGRAGAASDSPRADPRPPPHRRRIIVPARVGQVHR